MHLLKKARFNPPQNNMAHNALRGPNPGAAPGHRVPAPQQPPAAGLAGGAVGGAPAPPQNPPVTTQDFLGYLNQERQIRQQDKDDWLAQMERARRQDYEFYVERVQQEQTSLDRQEEESAQRLAVEIANTVPICNGDSQQAVRDWLKELELTVPYTDRTLVVACRSARGGLREEIEQYLGTKFARRHKTWDQLKAHIKEAFLTPDEAERRIADLESIKQGPYESTSSYGRRFKQAADEAYPVFNNAVRNDTEQKLLWKHYLSGLHDARMAEKIVAAGNDQDYETAMAHVVRLQAKNHRVTMAKKNGWLKQTNQRQEEPMDVNVMQQNAMELNTMETMELPGVETDVRNLKRQVSGISHQMNRMMAMMTRMAVHQQQPQPCPPQDHLGALAPDQYLTDPDYSYPVDYPHAQPQQHLSSSISSAQGQDNKRLATRPHAIRRLLNTHALQKTPQSAPFAIESVTWLLIAAPKLGNVSPRTNCTRGNTKRRPY